MVVRSKVPCAPAYTTARATLDSQPHADCRKRVTERKTVKLSQRVSQPLAVMCTSVLSTCDIVTSMYPIDAMFGDILCGPFACPPDDNDSEEFCGWAMAAGVVAGIISASAGGKLFDLGLVAFGAGLALLPALLLQPVFDYALQAHASWTRYVHYLVFGALGAP